MGAHLTGGLFNVNIIYRINNIYVNKYRRSLWDTLISTLTLRGGDQGFGLYLSFKGPERAFFVAS
jgi:hypothetical protein